MLQVIARYAPVMIEERRRRILAAFKRCGVQLVRKEKSGMTIRIGKRKVPVPLTDVEWLSCLDEDGIEETGTELIISGFGTDRERAVRLVSELRCCGMTAAIDEYDDEH